MKTTQIHSSCLPHLDQATKECVNFGHWLLYRVQNDNDLYLRTEKETHRISNDGMIIEMSIPNQPPIDTLLYFSDLPFPPSLSNISLAK